MPSRLIYLPLEPYSSRYTQYTAVKDGVVETCLKDLDVNFLAIRPDELLRTIKQGQVLDVQERYDWSTKQIKELVRMICEDEIDPKEDVIYLDDFWTFGFEAIPYALSSKFGPNPRAHPKVYSFVHAQSVDPYDFTAKWAYWMRPLEKMWFGYQHKIFCADKEMLPLIMEAGIPITDINQYKVIPVGHIVNVSTMLRIAGNPVPMKANSRFPLVVYSSRFDSEKNPHFFMDLMEEVIKERPEVQFAICTGQPTLTSTDSTAIQKLGELINKYPKNSIRVHSGLTLHHYYQFLCSAKVQINTAIQDWISYTLVDATINGCLPLYPSWLSFPEALNKDKRFLYKNMDIQDAKEKLYALLDTKEEIDLSFVYSKYDATVKRICQNMGFKIDE